MTYKIGGYATSETSRAPLVRGKTYKIENVIEEPFSVLLRLEGVPMLESATFFRPASDEEVSRCEGASVHPDQMPLQFTDETPVSLLKAPDDNPKTRFGMAKPPLGLIPATAKVHLSMAFKDGAQKYGPANWRVKPVSCSTYLNAAHRHMDMWQDGEECASDSGVHHLAHAAACLLIILDAQANNSLNDDRPPPAITAELIKKLTEPMA